jgi:DNA-binding GntR family transcriptional regulator
MAQDVTPAGADAPAPASAGIKRISAAKQIPLAEQAYLRLHEAIRNEVFKPGQRMMEKDLAKWLDMSRTPVRDALRRLETEGVVVHEPHLGLVITQFDQSGVMELYSIREILEGTAAGFAARHATEFEISQLMHLVDSQHALKGDTRRLGENNERFHRTIYQAAHNRFLIRSLDSALVCMGLLSRNHANLALEKRMQDSFREHEAVALAISRRKPKEAEEAARAHVRGALQERLKLFPPGG